MLRCAASYLVVVLFWGHFRIQTTEGVGCTVNITEINASADSVLVKVNTPGSGCNFTVFYNETPHTDGLDCDLFGDSSNAYTCEINPLEAGTLYSLVVQSKSDGERAVIAVRTGKKKS
ncbi:unnamed protein product [Boreogadus saida]